MHAEPWFGSKVKLKKLSLMMLPVGTVMFQVQLLFAVKLFGKLGLVKNPLVPLRKSPGGTHATKEINMISHDINYHVGRIFICEVQGKTRISMSLRWGCFLIFDS